MVDLDPRCAPPPEIVSRHDHPSTPQRLGFKPKASDKWRAQRAQCVSQLTLGEFFGPLGSLSTKMRALNLTNRRSGTDTSPSR
jgi:hypothetical protein